MLFCKACPVVMNSLRFCSSGDVFISPLFLKYSFAAYNILGWQYFSFSILNIPFHSLLSFKNSTEKSADSLLGVCNELVDLRSFYLLFFKLIFLFLCLSYFWDNNGTNVPLIDGGS